MKNPKLQYYVKLCLALLMWAGMYHVVKPAAELGDPVLIAFIRYFISAGLLLVVLRVKTKQWIPKLTLQQWLLIFCIGVIGICVYNILFFNAEALISGNIVAILYSFTPCLTTVISAYVFKNKLNRLSKIGILIALCGSIGVVNYATPECGQFFCSNIFASINRGEIYGVLATIAFACYSVLSKYTAQKNVSAMVLTAYSALVGCILLGVVALFQSDFNMIGHFNLSIWLALIYMSVFGTVVSYLWYTAAIINLGVFKTVVFQNTIPLQTVIIGYIFYHDEISRGVMLCGGVVLFGVYLTNFALSSRRSS